MKTIQSITFVVAALGVIALLPGTAMANNRYDEGSTVVQSQRGEAQNHSRSYRHNRHNHHSDDRYSQHGNGHRSGHHGPRSHHNRHRFADNTYRRDHSYRNHRHNRRHNPQRYREDYDGEYRRQGRRHHHQVAGHYHGNRFCQTRHFYKRAYQEPGYRIVFSPRW